MEHFSSEKDIRKNPFEPINETVYKHLYNAIITLEYKPGTKLIESQIASELNVSRSPVKAALQRLEYENLVEHSPGKSPCVARVQYEDCCAMLEARKGIEGYAAYYAAIRITNEELHQLKEILLKFKINDQIPASEEYAKTDDAFHQLIINASHNKYLMNAYSIIQSNLLRYRLYIMRRTDLRELHEYEHHLPIYYALKNHCATLAKNEILVSIEHMKDAIRFL